MILGQHKNTFHIFLLLNIFIVYYHSALNTHSENFNRQLSTTVQKIKARGRWTDNGASVSAVDTLSEN